MVLPIPPNTYATTFLGTENPLSESGRWIQGATTGVLWGDVRCTPGLAFGNNISPSPPYNDPTAVLAGAWGPIQTAEAVIKTPASSAQNQEVELRLLTRITPNRIVGYEFLFSVTNNAYREIMRWDGGITIDKFFSVTGGPVFGAQLFTGMKIKATVTAAGLLTGYVDFLDGNGWTQVMQGTDTTYREGSPGIGFFQHGGSSTTLPDFGLSSFSAWAT